MSVNGQRNWSESGSDDTTTYSKMGHTYFVRTTALPDKTEEKNDSIPNGSKNEFNGQ